MQKFKKIKIKFSTCLLNRSKIMQKRKFSSIQTAHYNIIIAAIIAFTH